MSYCILAGIGVSSILVFWMVSLHRSRERQRRLARAKRAFTNRWHSVTSSLGLAASAVAALKATSAAAGGGGGDGDGGGVQGSAPSSASARGGLKAGAARLRPAARMQSARVSWGSEVAANAAAAGAAAAAGNAGGTSGGGEQGAMPASPFEAAQPPADRRAAGRGAGTAAAAATPALARADSHDGSGVQLLQLQPRSSAGKPAGQLEKRDTISGPQGGGECGGLTGSGRGRRA